MLRRALTVLLVLSLMVIVGILGVAQEKVTLTLVGAFAGAELDAFMPVIEAFEAETGINITYVTIRSEDLGVLLPAQFAAGRTVGDVLFMPWTWFIQAKGEEGHLLDLADQINVADFIPGSVELVTVGEKIYGLPYTGKLKPGFWYRLSFFEDNGLTVPETYEEFVELLDKIAEVPGIVAPIGSGNGVGWPLSDIAEHFLTTFGGLELRADLISGDVAWTDPAVKKAFMDGLIPLLEGGYFGEPTEWTMAMELWWGGDYGLYSMGSWLIGMVDDPTDLGVMTLPGCPGVVFGAGYAFVPTYTEHPEEAKQLAKFLATRGQVVQIAQGGHLATYMYAPRYLYPELDRRMADLMLGGAALVDMDDTIGGAFQEAFWDQLKLLWVAPGELDEALEIWEEKVQ